MQQQKKKRDDKNDELIIKACVYIKTKNRKKNIVNINYLK